MAGKGLREHLSRHGMGRLRDQARALKNTHAQSAMLRVHLQLFIYECSKGENFPEKIISEVGGGLGGFLLKIGLRGLMISR
jgi:hypothetical protein